MSYFRIAPAEVREHARGAPSRHAPNIFLGVGLLFLAHGLLLDFSESSLGSTTVIAPTLGLQHQLAFIRAL